MIPFGMIKEVAKKNAYLGSGVFVGAALATAAIETAKHVVTLAVLAVVSFALGSGFQIWVDKLEFDRLIVIEQAKRERRRSVVMAWRKRK